MNPEQPEENSNHNPWRAGNVSTRNLRPPVPQAKEIIDGLKRAAFGMLAVTSVSIVLVGAIGLSRISILASVKIPSTGTQWFQVGVPLTVLAIQLFIAFGAWNMWKCRSYPIAYAACILALIPFISPLYIMGIPFGIWGLIVLNNLGARQVFDRY